MILGEEWIIEAFGCSAAGLRDLPTMRCVCQRIVAELDLQVVGEPQWQQFPPPGGVTGLYLLTESHLSCHTWPEHQSAAFNLFTCRKRARWTWEDTLAEVLQAQQVRVRRVERAIVLAASPDATAQTDPQAQRVSSPHVAAVPSPVAGSSLAEDLARR